jgi:flagellar biogenesis protein FliO
VSPPDLSEPVDVDDPTGVAGALDDLIWPFIKTMLMLCLVLGLVYLTLNKGLGKLMQRTQAGKRIKVVERVTLDQRRAIFLVEVDGEEILLAAGEGGVVRLDQDKPAPAAASGFDIGARDPSKPPPVTGVRASGERVSLAVDDEESEGSDAA